MTTNSLSPQQTKAIYHLLEAPTVAEAARLAGVSRSTIYNWLGCPAFRAKLETAQRADDQARLNALRALVPAAIKSLEGLLASKDERIRLRAASEIIKTYQSLASKEEVSEPLFAEGQVWNEWNVPALATRSVEALVNGRLNDKAAALLPQYLWFLDKALKDMSLRLRHVKTDRLSKKMLASILKKVDTQDQGESPSKDSHQDKDTTEETLDGGEVETRDGQERWSDARQTFQPPEEKRFDRAARSAGASLKGNGDR